VLFIHKQMLLLQRMTNLEEKTRQRSEVVDASAVLPTKLRYYDGGLSYGYRVPQGWHLLFPSAISGYANVTKFSGYYHIYC